MQDEFTPKGRSNPEAFLEPFGGERPNFQQNVPVQNGFGHVAPITGMREAPLEGFRKKITNSVDRITGIDIARALCILGMVLAHFVPEPLAIHPIATALSTVNGRAAMGFVLISGIGMGLLDRAKGPKESAKLFLWRGAILFITGITLQAISPGPVIILQFYTFYYVIGWLGARLSSWLLGATAMTWIVVGCALWWLNAPELEIVSIASPPIRHLYAIAYTGQYPLITWAPAVLIGVLLSRLDFKHTKLVLALAASSVMLLATIHALVWYVQSVLRAKNGGELPLWATTEAHSHTIFYLTDAYTSAVLLVCLCVLAAPYLGKVGQWLAIAGRQAFTLYVTHLGWLVIMPVLTGPILDAWLIAQTNEPEFDDLLVLVSVVKYFNAFTTFFLLLLQAVLWNLFFRIGPLERLLHRPRPFGA